MSTSSRRLLQAGFLLAAVLGLSLVSGNIATRAQTFSVVIKNFAFTPATLTVPVGATVTWTNGDDVSHTVTSDTGLFDSQALAAGATYSFTFSTAGSFAYHCSIHPFMKGTVVVTSAGPNPTATVPGPPPMPSQTPSPTAQSPTSTPSPTAAPAASAGFRVHVLTVLHAGKTANFRVHVAKRGNGKAVAQARVVLNGKGVGIASTKTAKTNGSGVATFKRLHPARRGTIVLHVSKSGFHAATVRVRVT